MRKRWGLEFGYFALLFLGGGKVGSGLRMLVGFRVLPFVNLLGGILPLSNTIRSSMANTRLCWTVGMLWQLSKFRTYAYLNSRQNCEDTGHWLCGDSITSSTARSSSVGVGLVLASEHSEVLVSVPSSVTLYRSSPEFCSVAGLAVWPWFDS